jgi:nitrite reductase (NADH) large subunit
MRTVIIGNSAAGLNALESFRKYDSASPVTIISSEPGPAYSRVLLPYYLRGRISFDNLFINSLDYYQKLKARTIFEKTVIGLDHQRKMLTLSDASQVPFDKLLIASGARPAEPNIKNLHGPGIYHMWTLKDVQNIAPYFRSGKKLLVLGSGFVSLQAAWSAWLQGLKVTIYEIAPRIMPQVLDETAAAILQRKIIEHGVNLKVGTFTEKVERNPDGSIGVYAKNQETINVDIIIVGTGVCPNTEFLKDSKIMMERGILVNDKMETNVPGIYAAGDVVQGPTAFGESHVNHALWPTAVEQGKVAGANMAGENMRYQGSLNMNVTQMFGLTVASMGKFLSSDKNYHEIIYCPPQQGKYLKVVFAGEVPVGGITVGDAEQVAFLGMLRPFIRQKKKVSVRTKIKDMLKPANCIKI